MIYRVFSHSYVLSSSEYLPCKSIKLRIKGEKETICGDVFLTKVDVSVLGSMNVSTLPIFAFLPVDPADIKFTYSIRSHVKIRL